MRRTTKLIAAIAALGLFAMGGTALGAVQVGSSGWLWGNPLPQGNSIVASSFAGATGYAVGEFGTIVKTTDGGSTWAGLSSGTFTNLSEVQAIDAQALFVGGGCVARRSDDGGQTFTRVAFTPVESTCPQALTASWWVSRTTGYLVLADGTVLRTDNNGQSFSTKIAIPGTPAAGGNQKVNDLVFLTADVGLATTNDGKIYRTTDGAGSWTVVNDTNRQVRRIAFRDASNGVAVGDQSLFLVTTNGGVTWTPKALALAGPQNLQDVSCASDKVCIMATGTNTLVSTTDGGDAGTLVAPSQSTLNTASFATGTRIAALGALGATSISDDAGATFRTVGGRLSGTYSAMIAGPANVAFAPGDNGGLARTNDGGQTWVRGSVATSEDVRSVSFPSSTDGFALDVAGGLFRTGDGGGSWRALDTGSTARPAGVYAPSASIVMVVGPRGIRRSTDAGDSFAAIKGSINTSQLNDVDGAGTAIFAYGVQDLWRSTDKGKTWTVVRKPGKYAKKNGKSVNRKQIKHADFVNATTGYLLDTSGVLYRTANGGKSWSTLTAVGTNAIYGLGFASASKGYAVISRFGDTRAGYLLRTSDSGKTWTPEYVVSEPIDAEGVAAGSNGVDYLLGGSSNLLFTTTGGLTGAASKLTITTKTKSFKKVPKGNITVTGKLSPTQGADRVTVGYLPNGSTSWRSQTVKVASNGSYTTSWRIAKGTNTFVAQWAGNFQNAGKGTTPLVVKVG